MSKEKWEKEIIKVCGDCTQQEANCILFNFEKFPCDDKDNNCLLEKIKIYRRKKND